MASDNSQNSPRVMVSLGSQNQDIRKIKVYRNGDENFYGKELVFNRRQVRDIDHLLQKITDHVELDRCARSIHTPNTGSKVTEVDKVTDKAEYVVVGYGKFKQLEYGKLFDRHVTRMRDNKKHSEEADIRKPLKPVEPNRYAVPGRIRDATLDVIPIYVFENGNDREPAKRIILTRRMMAHWKYILTEISVHVQPQYGATQHLCTMDGERVVHKNEIEASRYYVAVGFRTPYKRLNYGYVGRKPVFTVSPRVNRNLTNGVFPYERPRNSVLSEEGSLADTNSLPPMSTQSEPVTNKRRSRANRIGKYKSPAAPTGGENAMTISPATMTTIENLTISKRKIIYNDGKEVFPSRAVRPAYRHQEPLPAIQDSDRDGGPYRANHVRSETADARQIDDTDDTKTDLPLDMQRAEEIEEEQPYGHTATQTTPMNKTRRVTRGTKRNGDHYNTTTSHPKQSNIRRDTRGNYSRHDDDNRRNGKIYADDNDSVEEMEKTTKSAGEEDMERNHVEYNEEEDMAEGDRTARKSPSRTVEQFEEDETAKTHQDLEEAARSTPNDDDATGTVELERNEEDETATMTLDLENTQENEDSTDRKSPDAVESPRHHDEDNNGADDDDDDRDAMTNRNVVDENDEAATKIQAAFRGHRARRQLEKSRNRREIEHDEQGDI